MNYLLRADLDERVEMKMLDAENADDAMMQAIGLILDYAIEDQTGPWAIGHILLTDNGGNAIAEMKAK